MNHWLRRPENDAAFRSRTRPATNPPEEIPPLEGFVPSDDDLVLERFCIVMLQTV